MSRWSGYSTSPKGDDEHTDLMADWEGCQSKGRWRTPGWQNIPERTPVQGSMSNTRMSIRIGENAIQGVSDEHTTNCKCQDGVDKTPARRTMANTRVSRRIKRRSVRRAADRTRKPLQGPMTNTQISSRVAPNASPKADGEHTDVKTDWKNVSSEMD
jgi:hypothetical protein